MNDMLMLVCNLDDETRVPHFEGEEMGAVYFSED